jgi:hypothetical protein
MELAATYDRPLVRDIRLQLYGGPAGEPALGPTAFPHRISAMPSPLAPISHHWLDSTHITYGVVTGGVYGKRWKAETSVFNGREPDEDRTNFDFGALDSWSGRVWFLPTSRWALQVSAGHLTEAEAGHDGGHPLCHNTVIVQSSLACTLRNPRGTSRPARLASQRCGGAAAQRHCGTPWRGRHTRREGVGLRRICLALITVERRSIAVCDWIH